MRKILVTGATGFIGYHVSELLLSKGYAVVGVDSISSYYDVRIKNKRLGLLKKHSSFKFFKLDISNYKKLEALFKKEKPDEIVHLAAQAGVRYSLVNPWAYASANYLGTMNIFEVARRLDMPRVIYASSSSVYGANEKQPFSEEDRTDRPISLYGATKRANELLAYSYNHLYGIEMIGLRFFTVYGPWGRPDMAIFKFASRILSGRPIDLYNNGQMKRSFTYVSDIAEGVMGIIEKAPAGKNLLYNLGGAEAVPLAKFVELIEKELGKTAVRNMMPLQSGDVPETLADCSAAERDFGYKAKVSIEEGIARFANWMREHEKFALSLKEPKQ
jgi:UDP-glucuronate 4-epimerase